MAAGRCCCHAYCPRTNSTGVVTACCLRSEVVPLHDVCPVCCGLIASKILLKQAAKTTHAAASHVLYVNVVTCGLRKVKHWFSIFRHTLKSASYNKESVRLNLDSYSCVSQYRWCVCSQSDLLTWSISETKKRRKMKDLGEMKVRLK